MDTDKWTGHENSVWTLIFQLRPEEEQGRRVCYLRNIVHKVLKMGELIWGVHKLQEHFKMTEAQEA